MIRTFIAVALIFGLFPEWGHRFVNVSCEVVRAITTAAGGIDNFAMAAIVIAAVVYVRICKK